MFQFTHPGRGATWVDLFIARVTLVSIHAPREGCDLMRVSKISISSIRFNSRTPGGVRHLYEQLRSTEREFQFTHPGRGATSASDVSTASRASFNSRTPGGVRQYQSAKTNHRGKFQFTHPGRGATMYPPTAVATTEVSIHAPREGCD